MSPSEFAPNASTFEQFTAERAALSDTLDRFTAARQEPYRILAGIRELPDVVVTFTIGEGLPSHVKYTWDAGPDERVKGTVRAATTSTPQVRAGDRAAADRDYEDEEYWALVDAAQSRIVDLARQVLTPDVIRDHVRACSTDRLAFLAAGTRGLLDRAQELVGQMQTVLVDEQVALAPDQATATLVRAIAGARFAGDPDTLLSAALTAADTAMPGDQAGAVSAAARS